MEHGKLNFTWFEQVFTYGAYVTSNSDLSSSSEVGSLKVKEPDLSSGLAQFGPYRTLSFSESAAAEDVRVQLMIGDKQGCKKI
jgi:hypothetical protein